MSRTSEWGESRLYLDDLVGCSTCTPTKFVFGLQSASVKQKHSLNTCRSSLSLMMSACFGSNSLPGASVPTCPHVTADAHQCGSANTPRKSQRRSDRSYERECMHAARRTDHEDEAAELPSPGAEAQGGQHGPGCEGLQHGCVHVTRAGHAHGRGRVYRKCHGGRHICMRVGAIRTGSSATDRSRPNAKAILSKERTVSQTAGHGRERRVATRGIGI